MKTFFVLIFVFFLISCDNTSRVTDNNEPVALLPYPKDISTPTSSIILTSKSKIYTSHDEVKPLLTLFQSEIEKLTGIELRMASSMNYEADVIFTINTQLSNEEYQIEVDKNVRLSLSMKGKWGMQGIQNIRSTSNYN